MSDEGVCVFVRGFWPVPTTDFAPAPSVLDAFFAVEGTCFPPGYLFAPSGTLFPTPIPAPALTLLPAGTEFERLATAFLAVEGSALGEGWYV